MWWGNSTLTAAEGFPINHKRCVKWPPVWPPIATERATERTENEKICRAVEIEKQMMKRIWENDPTFIEAE